MDADQINELASAALSLGLLEQRVHTLEAMASAGAVPGVPAARTAGFETIVRNGKPVRVFRAPEGVHEGGQFSKPEASWAKAIAMWVIRGLLARDYIKNNDGHEGYLLPKGKALAELGVPEGTPVRVRYHDDQFGLIDVFDRARNAVTPTKVSWDRFLDDLPDVRDESTVGRALLPNVDPGPDGTARTRRLNEITGFDRHDPPAFDITTPQTDIPFNGGDFRHANLAGVDLRDRYAMGADFTGAFMVRSNLADTRLADANFEGAVVQGANLAGADLTGAKLTHSRFDFAKARGADFRGIEANFANLSYADLRDTTWDGNLRYANLASADLRGADLTGVTEMPQAEHLLSGARYDKTTRFPDGYTPPAHMVNDSKGTDTAPEFQLQHDLTQWSLFDQPSPPYDPAAAQAHAVPYSPSTPELTKRLADGGFTLDPAAGTFPTHGVAVGIPPHTVRMTRDHFDQHGEAEIAKFLDQLAESGAQPLEGGSFAVGGWYDDSTGDVVLDAVEVFTNDSHGDNYLGAGVRAGVVRNQEGVYHLDQSSYIPTGGDGGRNPDQVRGLDNGTRRRDPVEALGGNDPGRAPDAGQDDLPGDPGGTADLTPPTAGGDGDSIPPAGGTTVGFAEPPDPQPVIPGWGTDQPEPDTTNVAKALDANGYVQAARGATPEAGQYTLRRSRTKLPGTVVVPGTATDTGRMVDVLNGVGFDAKAEPTGRVRVHKGLGGELAKGLDRLASKVIADIVTPGGDSLIRDVLPGEVNTATRLVPDIVPEPGVNASDQLAQQAVEDVAGKAADQLTEEPPADQRPDIWDLRDAKITKTPQVDGTVAVSIGGIAAGTLRPDARYPGQWLPYDSNGNIPKLTYKDELAPSRNQPRALKYLVDRFMADRAAAQRRGEDVPPLRPNLVSDRQSTDTYTVAAGSKHSSVPLGRVRKVGKDKNGAARWEATTPDGRTVDTGTPFRTRAMAEDALIRAYDDPSIITGIPTAPEPDDGTVKVPWSTSKPKVTTANVNKLLTANGLEHHWRPNGAGTYTAYPQSRDLEGKNLSASVFLRAGDAATADRVIEIATAAGFRAERMGDSTRPDAMLQISRPRVQVPAPEWVRTAMGNAQVDTPYTVGSDGDSTFVRFDNPPTPADLTEATTALGVGGYNAEQGTDETGATVLWVTPGVEPLGSAATPDGFEKVQATRLAPGDTFIPSTPKSLDTEASNLEAAATAAETAGDTFKAQTDRNRAARIRSEIADGFTHRIPTTTTKGTEQPYTVKAVTKSPSGIKGTPNLRVETTTGEVFNMTARQRVLLPTAADAAPPATPDASTVPVAADQITEIIDDTRRRVPGSPGYRPTETGAKNRVLSSPAGRARFVEGARRADRTYEPDTIQVAKHFDNGTTQGFRDVGRLDIGSASSTAAPTLIVGNETLTSPVPASDPAGVRRWAYTQLADRGFLDGTDTTPGSKTNPALSPGSKAGAFLTADQTDRLAAYYTEFGGAVYDSTIADRPDALVLAGEALDLFRDRYKSPVIQGIASRYPADRQDRALAPQAAATVLNGTANMFREARALGVTDTAPITTPDATVTPVQFKVVLPGGIEGRTVRDGFLTADGTEIVDANGVNLAPVDQARILSKGDPVPALPGATDIAPAPEPVPEPTPEPAAPEPVAPETPAAPDYTGGARQVTRRGQTFDVAADGTVTRDGKRVARTTANLVRQQAQNEAGTPSPTPVDTPSVPSADATALDRFDVAPDGTVTLNGRPVSGEIADNARRRAEETGRWTPPDPTPATAADGPPAAPLDIPDVVDTTPAAVEPAQATTTDEMSPLDAATVDVPAEPETPPTTGPLPSGKFPPTFEQLDALAKFATGKDLVIEAGAGAGKALRDDQPVLTDRGWVPISNIRIGDRVAGTDGFGEVTGVYPQGVRDTVEVVLSDGQVIVCDWDHLWDTQTEQERKRGVFSTKTTREIADTIRARGGTRKQHYLPTVQPVKFPEADLPLDPWLLGYLLGNGSVASGRYISVSSADDWALEAVTAALPGANKLTHNQKYDWRISGSVAADIPGGRTSPAHTIMRDLGLWGIRDEDKFIPESYLFASVDQRRALLAGLLDADGYAEGRNCEIFTVSPRLAAGIRELCNSLGWTATGSPKTPTFTHNGERRTGQTGTRFYITPARGENPFTMPRKRDAFTPRSKYPARRCIVEIREAAPASCTCISVDTPDRLFLTAGYTPTHNTASLVILANLARQLGRKGIFTAFNKAIVEDAKSRMPEGTTATTMHSLAYKPMVAARPDITERMKFRNLSAPALARKFSIGDTELADGTLIRGPRAASLVMMGRNRFTMSDDAQPDWWHIPSLPDADPDEDRKWRKSMVPALRRVWADIENPDGELRMFHGDYLKLFQLSNPNLGLGFIMMDEAQDTSPVMEAILMAQRERGTQIIAVGDSAQAINGFTGARDALARLKGMPGVEAAQLTQSFRFGPEIAQAANNVLARFTDFRIAGSGKPGSIGPVPEPDAILTRTNGAAMATAMNALADGRTVAMSVNLKKNLTSFAEGVKELIADGTTSHPDLAPFASWGDVKRFVESDPAGEDLRVLVKLVDDYGPDNILDTLNQVGEVLKTDADVNILTAHTSKGLQFPTVRLADDFPPLFDPNTGVMQLGDDDFMLMYVALTRAQQRLDPGANDWILSPPAEADASPAAVAQVPAGFKLPDNIQGWLDDYLATPDTNAADGYVPVPDTVVAPYKTVEPIIARRGANTWMRKVTGPGTGPGKLGGRDDKANFEYVNGDHLFTVDKVAGGWTVVPNLPGGEDALYQIQTATGSRNGEVKIRQWVGVVDGVPRLYDDAALVAADRAGLDWSNPKNLTPTDLTADVANVPLASTGPDVADVPLVDVTPTPDAGSPTPAAPAAPEAAPALVGPYAEFLTGYPGKVTETDIAAHPQLGRLAETVLQDMASAGDLGDGFLRDVYATADQMLTRKQRQWDSEATYDRGGNAVDFDAQGARPERISLTPGQARGVLNSARRWMKTQATPNEPATTVDDTGTGVPSPPDVPAGVADGIDDIAPPAGWPESRQTAPWTAEQTWAGVSRNNPELSADQIRNGTLVMGYTHGPQDASGRATVEAVPGITKGDDFYPAAAPASLRMAPRFGGPAGLAKWFATEKVGGRSAAKNSPLTPTDLSDLNQTRIVGETLGSAPSEADSPRFRDYMPAQEIDAAIDSYPAQIRQEGSGAQAPYDTTSLAEIYSPRVRQLLDLQAQGFTHARWGWDPENGQNRWFGVTPESPEARNDTAGPSSVIDGDAEMMARYEADMAAEMTPEGGWASVPISERPVSVLLGASYNAEDIRRLLRMSGLSASQRSELRDLLDAMTGGRTAAVNHPEPTMGEQGDPVVNITPLDDLYPGGATIVADRRPGTTTPVGDAHTAALAPTGDTTVLLIDGEPAAEWAPGVTPTADEVAAVTATLGWQLNGADNASTWELTPAPPTDRCRAAGMNPTWLVAADNYLSRIGVHRGDAVQVAYLDNEHGEVDVTNPDGSVTSYPVKWARFASAAPTPGVRTVHDPHFVGNVTAARSGNGQSTAERVRIAGVGYATVADKYLDRYGIEKGDTVPVRWLDDTTAVIEAADGSTIHAAWARFTDTDPADLDLDTVDYVGGSTFDDLPIGARFAVEALGVPVRTPEGRVAALVKSDPGTYSLADNPGVAWRWDPISGAHLRLLVAADRPATDEEV